MATVGRGAPAPLGPRAFKPFPASALVRESDLRLSTTGYAGRARNLLLLLLRCTGAEVGAAPAAPACASTWVLHLLSLCLFAACCGASPCCMPQGGAERASPGHAGHP